MIFNSKNLSLLKLNPPKKIFIEFNTLKCGKRYHETLDLFKKLKEIAPLYFWQCDEGNYKKQYLIDENDIFSLYSNDISFMKSLSLRKAENYLIRAIRKISNLHITISLFNKSLKSTYYVYPTNKKINEIKKEILVAQILIAPFVVRLKEVYL